MQNPIRRTPGLKVLSLRINRVYVDIICMYDHVNNIIPIMICILGNVGNAN